MSLLWRALHPAVMADVRDILTHRPTADAGAPCPAPTVPHAAASPGPRHDPAGAQAPQLQRRRVVYEIHGMTA